jgi:hypothetical protein
VTSLVYSFASALIRSLELAVHVMALDISFDSYVGYIETWEEITY